MRVTLQYAFNKQTNKGLGFTLSKNTENKNMI